MASHEELIDRFYQYGVLKDISYTAGCFIEVKQEWGWQELNYSSSRLAMDGLHDYLTGEALNGLHPGDVPRVKGTEWELIGTCRELGHIYVLRFPSSGDYAVYNPDYGCRYYLLSPDEPRQPYVCVPISTNSDGNFLPTLEEIRYSMEDKLASYNRSRSHYVKTEDYQELHVQQIAEAASKQLGDKLQSEINKTSKVRSVALRAYVKNKNRT